MSDRSNKAIGAILLSLTLFSLVPAPVFAQTDSTQAIRTRTDSVTRKDSSAKHLDNVVITATRTATSAREIPQKIDIITSKDIEMSVANDVTNILKKQASVDVIEYPNLLSGISIRGFRPETGAFNRRSLMLIDGRPAGVGNLAAIPLDQIERIEVVKGATSALYGSSAMGGTVNIITKRSLGPVKSGGSIAYGSFNTIDLSGFTGGRINSIFDFDVSASGFKRGDDFRIGKGNLLRGAFGSKHATRIISPDSVVYVRDLGDGMKRSSTSYGTQKGAIRVGADLQNGLRADLRGELFRAHDVSFPGDIIQLDTGNGKKNMDRNSLDFSLSGAYGSMLPRVRLYTSTFNNDAFSDTSATRYANYITSDIVRGAQVQNVFLYGVHTITTGIDYTRTRMTTQRFSDATTEIAPYSPSSRQSSIAGFVQAHWRALNDRLTGTIGGRIDHISLYLQANPFLPDLVAGKHSFTTFNPSAGIQYTTSDGIRFHTSLGRAFLSPDAYDMAGQSRINSGTGTADTITLTGGNPTIKPENALTFDAGVGVSDDRFGFDGNITYFRTQVSDRITRVTALFAAGAEPTTSDGAVVRQIQTPVNASRAVMHGMEVEGGYDFGRLFNRAFELRLFVHGTKYFSAYDYTRIPSIDTALFPAGITDFSPGDVNQALRFGNRTNTRVRNVAPLNLTTGLEFSSFGRWSGRLTSRYVGSRLDTDFIGGAVHEIIYSPHAVVDLVGGMQVNSLIRLNAEISNLTDENYYEKRGYNLPGRALKLKVSVSR